MEDVVPERRRQNKANFHHDADPEIGVPGAGAANAVAYTGTPVGGENS